MFQVDKIFASVLPIGKYPLVSVSRVTVIVRLSWLVSLVISISVNAVYPCSYEPAAVLCIPLLPSGFFFTLLSFICLIFVCLIIGFSATIVFLKKARNMYDTFFPRAEIKIITCVKYIIIKCFRNKRRSTTQGLLFQESTIKLWRKMQ